MRARALLAAAGLVGLAACATAGVGAGGDLALYQPVPTDGVQGDAAAPSQGGALFKEKCGACHYETGMGTGLLSRRYEGDLALLENRENLTPQLITLAVRDGLGNMPRLSRAEVSDAQLDAISAYLSTPDSRED